MVMIKRDETNTKVINKDEVISFVNSSYYLNLLENYLSQLNTQTKVDRSEVESIIDVLNMRIEKIKQFISSYEEKKGNSKDLSLFYESNISFINGIIDNYIKEDNLDKATMKILIDFLKFCISKIKNNEINFKESQLAFDRFYSNNKYVSDKDYGELLRGIHEAYVFMLNKSDETSMDYVESNYNTAKSLRLSNNNSKFVEEEDIRELNSAAFIATTVVLEATALIGFIISLFMLVK